MGGALEPRELSRALGWLHVVGSTLSLLWLILPHPANANDELIALATFGAYAIAALLFGGRGALPDWALQASMLGTTTVITMALAASHQHGSVYALFYLWATLYAFCCFTRAQVALQTGAVAIAYAGALVLSPPSAAWSDDLGRWVMTIGTLVAAGWLVRSLTSRVADRERRIRASFEASSIGLAILDPLGNYTAVNPACERMLKRTAAELCGTNTRDVTHPDDWPRIERAAWRAFEYDATSQYEARYLHGDGGSGWGSVHLSLVRDSRGEPQHFFAQFEDITDRKRAEAERDDAERLLREQALHDSLTGLANRRGLLERFERERADAADDRSIAVLIIDLDRFKLINDSLGHASGDELLCQVAPRIQERLGADDLLARLGGDEFVVLAGWVHEQESLRKLGESVLSVFDTPFLVDGDALHVTASIGGALGDPRAPDALLGNADAAMYDAKENGRGRVELFGEELRERIVRRLMIENELRGALARGELSLEYQPIVAMATGRVARAEALMRWRRACGEQVAPCEFIPVAEETGLIAGLGLWAIETAAHQMAAWRRDGVDIRVAVNLSSRQLGEATLIEDVERAIAAAGIEPAALTLEVTESVLMDDSGRSLEALRELRALGVRLALDDFGTGYSSLSYLTRLPLDVLKLDRSFVAKLDEDGPNTAVTAAIVAMARALDLDVVAEGVEVESERLTLLDMGCVTGQGFLFARPGPPDAVAGHIASTLGAPSREGARAS